MLKDCRKFNRKERFIIALTFATFTVSFLTAMLIDTFSRYGFHAGTLVAYLIVMGLITYTAFNYVRCEV